MENVTVRGLTPKTDPRDYGASLNTMLTAIGNKIPQMSFDQTGVQVCLVPWVTRPLPTKKSTKIGKGGLMHSFE